jgi:hypothetical protein
MVMMQKFAIGSSKFCHEFIKIIQNITFGLFKAAIGTDAYGISYELTSCAKLE